MMNYAKKLGGPALRKMTFQERGLMLKALALHLHSIKNKFYALSAQTGATKIDSWIDIEGGIGNIFTNASLRKQFPDLPYHIDGDMAPLSKNGTFIGHHIMTPREGVAIHINAFNFPIWGMLEKIAVNLMAGVPAIVKPATLTSYLTEMMLREIVNSKILPEGSLQLICGSARGIIDKVETGDIVTFTGSASTGMMLKSNPRLIEKAVSFNMEADSLNCSVLAEDAVPVTAPVTAPNNLLAVIIPAWPASIPFECMVIAVPTTAVVNIPLLPLTKFEFIVVIFALVIDPNPMVAVSVMLIAVAATPVWSMNTVFKPTKWEVWVTSWIDRDLALTPAETFIPSSEVVTIPATFIVSFDIILLAVTKPATVYPAAENVLIPANLVVPVMVPTPVTWKLVAFISVSYTHLRAHETKAKLVWRVLL